MSNASVTFQGNKAFENLQQFLMLFKDKPCGQGTIVKLDISIPDEPAAESDPKPAAESAPKSAPKSAAESASNPAAESADEPAPKSADEPAPKSADEPDFELPKGAKKKEKKDLSPTTDVVCIPCATDLSKIELWELCLASLQRECKKKDCNRPVHDPQIIESKILGSDEGKAKCANFLKCHTSDVEGILNELNKKRKLKKEQKGCCLRMFFLDGRCGDEKCKREYHDPEYVRNTLLKDMNGIQKFANYAHIAVVDVPHIIGRSCDQVPALAAYLAGAH